MKSGSVSASGTAFERRRKCLRLLAAQFLDEIVARCGVGKIELFSSRQTYIDNMANSGQMDSIKTIMQLINEA